MLNLGGSSPELDAGFEPELPDPEDDPLVEPEGDGDGVEPEAGVDPAAGVEGLAALVSRVSLGGASSSPIPTGVPSAFSTLIIGSVPFGRQTPVPSQGIAALALLLCSALPTVNRPSELPVRSPSYTLPESSAMGTGSAL